MALITCSECGEQVSSTAAACPHCGAPISAAPAAEVRKCEECGTALPDVATACPNCGCPAQPVPAPRPAYIAPAIAPAAAPAVAPSLAPAHARLGSAKARIVEEITGKTALANAWLFLATAASIVMYLVAFFKFIPALNKLLDIAGSLGGKVTTFIGDAISGDMVTKILVTCKNVRLLLIAALVIAGVVFIGDLVKMSKKERMLECSFVSFILAAALWIPTNILSSFTGIKNATIQEWLDFFTKDDFGTYLKFSPFIILGLSLISFLVCAAVPNLTDFCANCGRNIKHDGVGGVCKGCGERKYVPGFMPIPRDVVAAYPYSGETLIGKSPVRGGHVFFIVLIDMVFGFASVLPLILGGLDGNAAAIIVGLAILALGIFFTVFQIRRGVRDKITVTPASVKLRIPGSRRLNASVSEITDVLTNESGDLAVCACGRAYVFTDISGRAQIAAALEALTSRYQTN